MARCARTEDCATESASPERNTTITPGRRRKTRSSPSRGHGAGAARLRAAGVRYATSVTAADTSASAPPAASAERQPAPSASGGRASAPTRPPSVRPVCLMPMARPRPRGGNHSSTALPVAGVGTLKPKPASTRQARSGRSEEHTSELQSRPHLRCRLLLVKKKKNILHRVLVHLVSP